MSTEDMPVDLELSRDADKIVTALTCRVDCRHYGDWHSGKYASALVAHAAHLKYCRGGNR